MSSGRRRDQLGGAATQLRAALRQIRRGALSANARLAFSQEGEDLLLARMFEYQQEGFYVDVGAHHPKRFSNTHLLYQRGWRGMNIDATPGSMDAFRRVRPRDINLEIAISTRSEDRTYYLLDDPALNSLSGDLTRDRTASTPYRLTGTVTVSVKRLSDVLDEHNVRQIDLLTVDAEGHDLEVLESNDWDRHRPHVVAVEVMNASIDELGQRQEVSFLREQGYRVFGKLFHTVVFTASDWVQPHA